MSRGSAAGGGAAPGLWMGHAHWQRDVPRAPCQWHCFGPYSHGAPGHCAVSGGAPPPRCPPFTCGVPGVSSPAQPGASSSLLCTHAPTGVPPLPRDKLPAQERRAPECRSAASRLWRWRPASGGTGLCSCGGSREGPFCCLQPCVAPGSLGLWPHPLSLMGPLPGVSVSAFPGGTVVTGLGSTLLYDGPVFTW